MDILSILATLIIIYLLLCIILSFFLDADLSTSWYDKLGGSLSKHLEGQVIWVTGASSGIGAAVAVEAAKHGAMIVLSARRKKELETIKTSCLDAGRYRDMNSADVLVLSLDMTSMGDHEGAVKTVLKKMGKISAVVHCAGRSQRGRWEKTELAVDKELFDVNVFGAVNLSRLVVPHMVDRNSGSFGVVTCVEAVLAAPFSGAYVASKQALHGYFTSLHNELVGSGIHVTFLVPGPTVSGLMASAVTEASGLVTPGGGKRMSAERCAHLCLVGLAHKIPYTWICSYPCLTMMYFYQYMPDMCHRLVSVGGPKFVTKMRGKFGETGETGTK